MKEIAVLLAPGFREVKAIVTIDTLRRLQIGVRTLACAGSRAVMSYHDVSVVADSTLAVRQADLYDAVALPGGPQGNVNLTASGAVAQFIARHDNAEKLICPVCSVATRVLGGSGLLKGRRYVCSGDLWQSVADGEYVDASVAENGNLISSRGLGHILDFTFTLSARLLEDNIPIRDHADHIYYRWQSLYSRVLRYSRTRVRQLMLQTNLLPLFFPVDETAFFYVISR